MLAQKLGASDMHAVMPAIYMAADARHLSKYWLRHESEKEYREIIATLP
jgi:hypothetical protein